MKSVARDSIPFAPDFVLAARPASVTDAAPLRVALTFDDSLKDHLLVAAPMLEERGWRGTFCIVTDRIGRDDSRLSWDDVRELVRRGHEIATHTASHRDLLTLLDSEGEEAVRREIGGSADRILAETGIAPDAKDISMKTEWLERILSSADDSGVLVRGIR